MSNPIEIMDDGTEIDVEKARTILKRITELEKRNIQTKQYSSPVMVDKIKSFIEEEVKCF